MCILSFTDQSVSHHFFMLADNTFSFPMQKENMKGANINDCCAGDLSRILWLYKRAQEDWVARLEDVMVASGKGRHDLSRLDHAPH